MVAGDNGGYIDYYSDQTYRNNVTVSTGCNVLTSAETYGDGEYFIKARQIKIDGPIMPNYDSKYAISTGTPSGCIGQILSATTYSGNQNLTTLTNGLMVTFTNLPIGVWLLNWNQNFFVPTTQSGIPTIQAGISFIQMFMGTTSGGTEIGIHYAESSSRIQDVGFTKSYSTSRVFSNTISTNDVYFTVYAQFTGTLRAQAQSFNNANATRIA